MTGRHVGGRADDFWRQLIVFGLKILFWGAVLIAAILVFRQIPGVGSAPDDASEEVSQETVSSVPPSTSTTTTTQPILAPADVTVLVLNSTQRSGLAGRLTETIASLGYKTLEAANYPTLLEESVLLYAPGFEEEAEELARVLPEMATEPNPEASQADLVIIIGSSYQEHG